MQKQKKQKAAKCYAHFKSKFI